MAHLLDCRLVETLEAWILTMNQETLPAFLIAGMTPHDIEALHYEAGRKIIRYGTPSLCEPLTHIQGVSFWYRISRQYHLCKTRPLLLLGYPILRGLGTTSKLPYPHSCPGRDAEL